MVPDQNLLNELEAALIERIKAPLEEIEVRVFAGDRKDGVAVLDRDFLCVFVGSGFSNPNNYLGTGDQDRVMTWQLSIRLKRLINEGHTDHYPMEQIIIKSLKGYQPHPCVDGAFYPVRTRLVRRDSEGYFYYECLIAIRQRFNNG